MSLMIGPFRGSGAAPVHTAPTLTPVQQLVTTIGGNISAGGADDPLIPALWYPDANVTLDAGDAAAIPEMRGTSGLSLTPALADCPYDPTTGLVTLNGDTGTLSTPSSSLLDVSSPCSLAIIGTLAGASEWYFALFGAGLLGMLSSGGFAAGGAGLQANYAQSSLADTDTALRLFIVSNGAGDVNLDIPNKAEVSATQAQSSPGANALTIGYYQSAGGTPFVSAFAFAMFWTRVRTTGDVAALKTFASTLSYVPAS